MSQQMHYDEAGQERQRPEFDNSYDPGYSAGYRDPFMGSAGQKLSMPVMPIAGKSASPAQRLALAIVSVTMLVPLAAIIIGTTHTEFFSLVGGLIGLGLICLTIMVINIVFNLRH